MIDFPLIDARVRAEVQTPDRCAADMAFTQNADLEPRIFGQMF